MKHPFTNERQTRGQNEVMEGHHAKLNQQALFTSETSDYRRPEEADEGDRVVVCFRTAKGGAEAVFYIEENKNLS